MKSIDYLSIPGIIVLMFAAVAYYIMSVMMDVAVESNMGDRIDWFAPLGALIFIVMGVVIWYMDVKINIEQEKKNVVV